MCSVEMIQRLNIEKQRPAVSVSRSNLGTEWQTSGVDPGQYVHQNYLEFERKIRFGGVAPGSPEKPAPHLMRGVRRR
jgi:hypothetical protein